MIFVYSGIILFILVLSVFICKNSMTRSLMFYLISSCIILISLLMYNIITLINYSLQTGFLEKAGYYIVLNLKLHVTDVVVFYNFGNFLLLISPVIFLTASVRKVSFWKMLLFIPPVVYFIINHPRIKYRLWIYFTANNTGNPFEWLVIINSALLIIYFILPLVQLCFRYFKTSIFSKKKSILSTAAYIFILETLMGLILYSNPYSNYYPLRYDVNSMPIYDKTNSGLLHTIFSVNSKYPEFILAVAVIIFLYIIFSDFFLRLNLKPRHYISKTEKENNEMIKTIFHTYKNAFFAIERFSSILEKRVNKEDKMANEALKNIKNISHTSYINSKRMIDSVILTYDFSLEKVRLDLSALLSDLLLQFEAVPNLKIEQDFPEDGVFINASTANLNEAFTNIINNSVEATQGRKNSTIKISLFTEGDSAVINFYDNGCGIRKSQIKHIFKPLYSFKQSTYNLGIGLSTALKTVSYYSGEISCKSKLNEYTVFQVVLPLANEKR